MDVKRIWDKAPHNGMTDLIVFHGKMFCAFREGKAHQGDPGQLRILVSDDGELWRSAAEIAVPGKDLRDPKLSIMPDGRLLLNSCRCDIIDGKQGRPHSVTYFSADGFEWHGPHEIGEPGFWFWRTCWHKGIGYSVAYTGGRGRFVRLYTTRDGKNYDLLRDPLYDVNGPSEFDLLFREDDRCYCLLRRDNMAGNGDDNGLLGMAQPPYADWQWQDVGARIAAPTVIQLPDGRVLAAVRKYKDNTAREWDKQWTELCWLDLDKGSLVPYKRLPSGGDSSYAGLVWFNDRLWVSYYSSHEEKTAIYLAKIYFDV